MATGYLDLFVEQGEDFTADISIDGINGIPFDLSNYSAKSQVRASHWSANTSATFNTEIISDPPGGRLIISLNAQTTQNLKAQRYVYDIFLTESTSNTRSKILEGTLYVDPSVTRI